MPLAQHQVHSAMGQAALLHGQTMLFIPTTDLDNTTLPLHPQHQQPLLRPCASHRTYKAFVLHPLQCFSKSLTASGRGGEIQLHLDLGLSSKESSLLEWFCPLAFPRFFVAVLQWVHLLGCSTLLVLFEEPILEDSVLELLRKEERKPCNRNYTKPKHIWESTQINYSNGRHHQWPQNNGCQRRGGEKIEEENEEEEKE